MKVKELMLSFFVAVSLTFAGVAFAGDPPKSDKPAAAKKAEAGTPTPGVKKIEDEGDKSDTKVKQPKLKKPEELKK